MIYKKKCLKSIIKVLKVIVNKLKTINFEDMFLWVYLFLFVRSFVFYFIKKKIIREKTQYNRLQSNIVNIVFQRA